MGINKNFVVRNGLEVATNLLYVNDEENRVGINTAVPEYNLDVQGDAKLDGKIVSAGDTSGITGQYLKSTGEAWEWETFPRSRASERYTLTAGQTRIPSSDQFTSFSLTEQELTSVYLDGVKLTVGDYSIDAGGGSITLFAAAFGGEEIEIIAHGATSVGTGNTGILGVTARKAGIASGDAGRITIFDFVGLGVTLDGRSGLCTVHIDSGGLSDVSGDPNPSLGGNLNLDSNDITGTGNISIVGYVTATSLEGDGSNITGISTLNITNYGVGLGGGTDVAGLFGKVNDDSAVGIFTDSAAVGLGTTNPRFQVEIGNSQGEIAGLGTNLWVNGDARITGILTVGSSSIAIDGVNDEIRIGAGFTLSADTITQTANLQITGIVTATGFDGDLVGQHKVFTAGVSNSDDYDVALFLDPTQGGHTFNRFDLGGKLQYNPSTGQLSNVGIISATGQIISGVTTHQGEVNFQSNINLGDNDIINVGSGNDLQISHTGSVSKIEEVGDGGLEIRANPTITLGKYTSENMGVFNADGSVDLYYNNSKKFETTGAGVSVTGVATATSFSGPLTGDVTGNVTGDATGLSGSPNITVNDIQVGGAVTVTGICSATSFTGSGIGLTGMVDVADGTYGGSTVSPQITVADGRITGITATLISGGGGGGGGGTEVIIEDNDSVVGTAGTINFGSGLSVSSATLGVVTVTAASAEVINDTTPQLGGNLDLNSRTINGTGNINITGSSRFNGIASFTSDVEIATGSKQINLIPSDGGNSDTKVQLISDNTGGFNGSRVQIITGSNGTQLVHLNDSPSVSEQYFAIEKTDGSGTYQQQMAIYSYADESWDFKTGSSSVSGLFIKNGNVGIGTTNVPSEVRSSNTSVLHAGIVTANYFYGDGSNLTGISAGGSGTGYFDNNQTNAGIHTTAAHVGLGTTNPRTPLQVEEVYGVYTDYGTFSATAGVTTTGDASWVIATDDFKTAEYTLYFKYNDNIQSQKVLVMNDGTTAYAQEYAIMYNNDLLVSVGASVNSGTCELQWTPEPGVTGIVTYRVVRETML